LLAYTELKTNYIQRQKQRIRKGEAHDFIDQEYWLSQKTEMRDKYIPMSDTYVIYTQAEIVGFVSMVEDYLAALFIDTSIKKKIES
jgi:hypothetical protein